MGSAHDEARLGLLKAVARQRLAAGQSELDMGIADPDPAAARGAPLSITATRMAHLWGAFGSAFDVLGDAGRSAG